MTPKPFLSTFECWMILFIFVMFIAWIAANIKNRIRAREEKAARKVYRERHNILRSTEPMNSAVSNKGNVTHKN